MNVARSSRPLGCLKAAFRQARFQRTPTRCLATAAAAPNSTPSTTTTPITPLTLRHKAKLEKVGKFHVWPQVPSTRAAHPDPMQAVVKNEISQLDPTGARTRLFSKEHADSAKVGDVLMVSTSNGEPFAGVFLQIRRRGTSTAIQLRGQMMKVSVEMWFKIYSPTTTGIDIVWRRPKRARRARLTYMRKPEHDMGSVDNLVLAWKKERSALRSKGAKGKRPGGMPVRR